jgi:hypothetical protein
VRLLIGFAGIPQPVFDFFRRAEEKLLEIGDASFAESCKRSDATYMAGEHAGFFLKNFAKAITADHHNRLSDTGFAVLYVSSHHGSGDFAERLFPSVLTIPIDWELSGYNRTTFGRSFDTLRAQLRIGVQTARRAIPAIKKEVTENDGRTPLLLPVRNFRSDSLAPILRQVREGIVAEPGGAVIRDARRQFESVHPPQKIGTRNRRCFVDDSGLEFHSPGSARHGFARDVLDRHPPACLVNGRRRLGAPYDRAFHYDCQREGRQLSEEFLNCHGVTEARSKIAYLNVAPNDSLRG